MKKFKAELQPREISFSEPFTACIFPCTWALWGGCCVAERGGRAQPSLATQVVLGLLLAHLAVLTIPPLLFVHYNFALSHLGWNFPFCVSASHQTFGGILVKMYWMGAVRKVQNSWSGQCGEGVGSLFLQVSKNRSNASMGDPELEKSTGRVQLTPGDRNPTQGFPGRFSSMLHWLAGFKQSTSPAIAMSLQTDLSVQNCPHLDKLWTHCSGCTNTSLNSATKTSTTSICRQQAPAPGLRPQRGLVVLRWIPGREKQGDVPHNPFSRSGQHGGGKCLPQRARKALTLQKKGFTHRERKEGRGAAQLGAGLGYAAVCPRWAHHSWITSPGWISGSRLHRRGFQL